MRSEPARASIVQLTDTHVARPGAAALGTDTGADLAAVVAAVNALDEAPAYAVVTGDVANDGDPREYERAASLLDGLAMPWYAIPGNHDEPAVMRSVFPRRAFAAAAEGRLRFAIDGPIRTLAFDVTRRRPWPGAAMRDDALDWLEAELRRDRRTPTIVAVHQPPFTTGVHALDVFGFRGGARMRRIVAAAPNVGRVACGHVHASGRTGGWGAALALTAPSTATHAVPAIFERGRPLVRIEQSGFALHAAVGGAFVTRILRADRTGRYVEVERY